MFPIALPINCGLGHGNNTAEKANSRHYYFEQKINKHDVDL